VEKEKNLPSSSEEGQRNKEFKSGASVENFLLNLARLPVLDFSSLDVPLVGIW
jgi:hypothetical protein